MALTANVADFKLLSMFLQKNDKTTYLLKPGTSQNDLKPAKTSRNQPKRSETSQNHTKNMRNDRKRSKISKLGKSGIFY